MELMGVIVFQVAEIPTLQKLVLYKPKLDESRNFILKYDKCKGKAILLQAWTGLEGSRRLRLPEFKTVSTGRW